MPRRAWRAACRNRTAVAQRTMTPHAEQARLSPSGSVGMSSASACITAGSLAVRAGSAVPFLTLTRLAVNSEVALARGVHEDIRQVARVGPARVPGPVHASCPGRSGRRPTRTTGASHCPTSWMCTALLPGSDARTTSSKSADAAAVLQEHRVPHHAPGGIRQMRDRGGRGRRVGRNVPGKLHAPSEQRQRGDHNCSHGVRRRRAHAAIVLGPREPRRIPYDICWRTRPLWLVDGLGLPGRGHRRLGPRPLRLERVPACGHRGQGLVDRPGLRRRALRSAAVIALGVVGGRGRGSVAGRH